MNFTKTILKPPRLTGTRAAFALAVAVAVDAGQALSGPAGWFLFDEVLDVVAMVLTSAALGFHPLLLPTFILKLLPVVDWMPTWTGCTVVVVLLRRRAQTRPAPTAARMVEPNLLPPPKEIPGSGSEKPPQIPKENSTALGEWSI